ncbi:hypothetical protein ACM01_16075 [Streptomyces viridochromogenes]|uniref:Uncharacterized protein n=1 Tax=Streptomyces viridochromogenes TaxID=1938 RepID=A0A0J7ZFG6_STRVR|nr:hypothetical protein [Streptomyces viridochromogenes]KMS74127.1 hypothetical protein ACM01_16075 [Streptomyces viridochromogenes]
MPFSFIDHRALTEDDITAFEQLIAAREEYGPYGIPPARPEPADGEWVLFMYTTLTAPGGKRLETEGIFKRWGTTQLVDMLFTPWGQALPDREPARTALPAPPLPRPQPGPQGPRR